MYADGLFRKLAAERIARREAYRWAAEQIREARVSFGVVDGKGWPHTILNRLADRIEVGPTDATGE